MLVDVCAGEPMKCVCVWGGGGGSWRGHGGSRKYGGGGYLRHRPQFVILVTDDCLHPVVHVSVVSL